MHYTPRVPPSFGGGAETQIWGASESIEIESTDIAVINGYHQLVLFEDAFGTQVSHLPATGYLAVYAKASTTLNSVPTKVTGFEDCLEVVVREVDQLTVDSVVDPSVWVSAPDGRAVAWWWGKDMDWHDRSNFDSANQALLQISGPPIAYAVYIRCGLPPASALTTSVRIWAVIQKRPIALSPSSWVHSACSMPPFKAYAIGSDPEYLFADAAANIYPSMQPMTCDRHFQTDVVSVDLSDTDTDGYYLPIFGGPWQMRMTAVSMEDPPDTLTGGVVDMSARTWTSTTAVQAHLDSHSGSSVSVVSPAGAHVALPWGKLETDGSGETTANVQITCTYGG